MESQFKLTRYFAALCCDLASLLLTIEQLILDNVGMFLELPPFLIPTEINEDIHAKLLSYLIINIDPTITDYNAYYTDYINNLYTRGYDERLTILVRQLLDTIVIQSKLIDMSYYSNKQTIQFEQPKPVVIEQEDEQYDDMRMETESLEQRLTQQMQNCHLNQTAVKFDYEFDYQTTYYDNVNSDGCITEALICQLSSIQVIKLSESVIKTKAGVQFMYILSPLASLLVLGQMKMTVMVPKIVSRTVKDFINTKFGRVNCIVCPSYINSDISMFARYMVLPDNINHGLSEFNQLMDKVTERAGSSNGSVFLDSAVVNDYVKCSTAWRTLSNASYVEYKDGEIVYPCKQKDTKHICWLNVYNTTLNKHANIKCRCNKGYSSTTCTAICQSMIHAAGTTYVSESRSGSIPVSAKVKTKSSADKNVKMTRVNDIPTPLLQMLSQTQPALYLRVYRERIAKEALASQEATA